ncbi:hypothetical protein LCGC14_0932880, partial [marine sediment metagenome]
LANRLIEYDINRRSASLARRIVSNSPDWDKTFLDEDMITWIDGFLVGDGSGRPNYRAKTCRLSCGVQHREFCDYLMSGLKPYKPGLPKFYYYKKSDQRESDQGCWAVCTRMHPDLYKASMRWYPDKLQHKQVPEDIRITPISVMLWYLGDGTVINRKDTCVVRLSTDSFPKEQIEDILIPKLKSYNIDCTRTSENRIRVTAKGIPAFFNLIGRTSPIKCYSYKFNLPEWRFEAKRMKEVADELGVSYNRISYLVKLGLVGCYRASERGRPRMLPEHIEQAKKLIANGELY